MEVHFIVEETIVRGSFYICNWGMWSKLLQEHIFGLDRVRVERGLAWLKYRVYLGYELVHFCVCPSFCFPVNEV